MSSIIVPLETTPIREEGYHVFVNIKVHGTEVRMLLDTGASRTVFDSDSLKRINSEIELEENEDKATGLGTNSVDNYIAIVEEIFIGTLKITDYQIGVLELSHVNSSYREIGLPPIAGVLGSDILVKHKALINFRKMELVLEESN